MGDGNKIRVKAAYIIVFIEYSISIYQYCLSQTSIMKMLKRDSVRALSCALAWMGKMSCQGGQTLGINVSAEKPKEKEKIILCGMTHGKFARMRKQMCLIEPSRGNLSRMLGGKCGREIPQKRSLSQTNSLQRVRNVLSSG